FLAEDCGSSGIQFYSDCNERHQWRGYKKKNDGKDHIKHSLDAQMRPRRREPVRQNQPLRRETFQPDFPTCFLVTIDGGLDPDTAQLVVDQRIGESGIPIDSSIGYNDP